MRVVASLIPIVHVCPYPTSCDAVHRNITILHTGLCSCCIFTKPLDHFDILQAFEAMQGCSEMTVEKHCFMFKKLKTVKLGVFFLKPQLCKKKDSSYKTP